MPPQPEGMGLKYGMPLKRHWKLMHGFQQNLSRLEAASILGCGIDPAAIPQRETT
jgi:hypothetical protein